MCCMCLQSVCFLLAFCICGQTMSTRGDVTVLFFFPSTTPLCLMPFFSRNVFATKLSPSFHPEIGFIYIGSVGLLANSDTEGLLNLVRWLWSVLAQCLIGMLSINFCLSKLSYKPQFQEKVGKDFFQTPFRSWGPHPSLWFQTMSLAMLLYIRLGTFIRSYPQEPSSFSPQPASGSGQYTASSSFFITLYFCLVCNSERCGCVSLIFSFMFFY